MERPITTVADVAKNYLCCSCGGCGFVCPENAISYMETPGGFCFPSVDRNRCTTCGECLAECPGIRLNVDLPEDPFAGESLGCWVGKAVDSSLYERSQSGGAVTALLMALLTEKRIGGAVTVTMKVGSPPRPAIRIARSRDELLASQGSKYCPVPVLTMLPYLEKERRPVAFIGLGCHVHGIRNFLERDPEVAGKTDLVIGLICDRIMASSAIDYLVWRSGLKDHEKSVLEYRSKRWHGYPGDVRIVHEDGREVFLPDKERRRIKDYFTPARCRLCFDKMNVLSDITFGDPWGIEEYDKAHGESVVIARTSIGIQTVQAAVDAGFLELREIPYEIVLQGQGIHKKRKEFAAYCREWTSMNMPLPAQSETALRGHPVGDEGRQFAAHLNHPFKLDQFSSKEDLFTDVRKWLRGQRLAKKVRKTLGSLSSAASFFRRKDQ